jgi:hypothetical protein
LENQQKVRVNTTRIAKISANMKNGSKTKYFARERQVQENPELTNGHSNIPMQNTTGRCKRIIQLNEWVATKIGIKFIPPKFIIYLFRIYSNLAPLLV